ncbi:HEPN domain-containing protein [Pyrococcus kukulkanii]|uniref:HEPN domain-containing protein n=1 Tax=Pyrococcus kukulkanii TaxID=1609559 RepID=UPI0035626DFA
MRDLEDAKFVFHGKRYNLACFLAQQAAEKALKAYLYYMGEEVVPGNSVSDLCKRAMKYDEEFKRICKAGVLDKYYIPTRYPNGLPGGVPYEAFDESDAKRAIPLAEMVIKFVKDKVEGIQGEGQDREED